MVVFKGYLQRQGMDLDELFMIVSRMEVMRLLLALVVQQRC
jgi:hypothetical protein